MLKSMPRVATVWAVVGWRLRCEPVALPTKHGPLSWLTEHVPHFGMGTGRADIVTPKDRSQPVGELSTSRTPQRLDAPD